MCCSFNVWVFYLFCPVVSCMRLFSNQHRREDRRNARGDGTVYDENHTQRLGGRGREEKRKMNERKKDRCTYRQTDRQTDRYIDRQIDRERDRILGHNFLPIHISLQACCLPLIFLTFRLKQVEDNRLRFLPWRCCHMLLFCFVTNSFCSIMC